MKTRASNNNNRTNGQRCKLLPCNICSAYLEKFGAECQLNFLLSVTTCCRNLAMAGRRERYCFLLQLYDSWYIISEISNCCWQIDRCVEAAASPNKAENRVKRWKRISGYGKRPVASCHCWSMYHLPLGFKCGVSDAWPWELLTSHRVSIKCNGAFSGCMKSGTEQGSLRNKSSIHKILAR